MTGLSDGSGTLREQGKHPCWCVNPEDGTPLTYHVANCVLGPAELGPDGIMRRVEAEA